MSLVWKTARPLKEGWYWRKLPDGTVDIAQVQKHYARGLVVGIDRHPIGVSRALAWAGPVARPEDPKPESLALVRYKLHGTFAPPRTHYWCAYDWEFQPRAEMLRQAKVRLCGDLHYYNQPVEADSTEVVLLTNLRSRGRWNPRSQQEVFTVANIDAAIAACTPVQTEKPAEAVV